MASSNKMAPTPDSETPALHETLAKSVTGKASVPDSVKKDVAKRKSKEPPEQKFTRDKDTLVTIEEYHALMEDRPIKFGPKSSGLIRGGGKTNPETACLHCVHFYSSPASAHTTCEVVRESDEKDQIAADDTCKLFSKDGQTLPLLTTSEQTE